MENRRNYYRILQVQPDAPPEIIRASYRTLMKELGNHPDMGGEHSSAYLLNEAYETLKDSRRRSEYDRKLAMRPVKSYTRAVRTMRQDGWNAPRSGGNQRSFDRMEKHGSLRYSFSWFAPDRRADMLDLSPKGVRFLCDEELRRESKIRIKGPLLKGLVKVVHSQKTWLNEKMYYTVRGEFLKVRFSSSKGTFLSTSA